VFDSGQRVKHDADFVPVCPFTLETILHRPSCPADKLLRLNTMPHTTTCCSESRTASLPDISRIAFVRPEESARLLSRATNKADPLPNVTRDFVSTVKTSVRARLQPCHKNAEKRSSLRHRLARSAAKRATSQGACRTSSVLFRMFVPALRAINLLLSPFAHCP